MTPEQRKANVRLALILVSVAAVFALGFVAKIAFFGAGWQIHAENLAAYLAGREPDDVEARWEELVPPYQDLAANLS